MQHRLRMEGHLWAQRLWSKAPLFHKGSMGWSHQLLAPIPLGLNRRIALQFSFDEDDNGNLQMVHTSGKTPNAGKFNNFYLIKINFIKWIYSI